MTEKVFSLNSVFHSPSPPLPPPPGIVCVLAQREMDIGSETVVQRIREGGESSHSNGEDIYLGEEREEEEEDDEEDMEELSEESAKLETTETRKNVYRISTFVILVMLLGSILLIVLQ